MQGARSFSHRSYCDLSWDEIVAGRYDTSGRVRKGAPIAPGGLEGRAWAFLRSDFVERFPSSPLASSRRRYIFRLVHLSCPSVQRLTRPSTSVVYRTEQSRLGTARHYWHDRGRGAEHILMMCFRQSKCPRTALSDWLLICASAEALAEYRLTIW